jgi:outer membrane protein assembly factor BamB/class 3 adenylate cyclase
MDHPVSDRRTEMTESSAVGQLTHGFLFSDLRGFTAYAEARGDAAAADLLDRYRALVRAVIAELGGAEIKTEGDSFYVVFPSASRAVAAGLAIVAAASRATIEEPNQPIRVGIGINAGEAEERPEGYVGTAVNLAARVCAKASVGEVLVTDTVRSLTRTSGRYRFRSRGHPTLKGIIEPIALYRVDPADGTAGALPPSRGRPVIGYRPLLAVGVGLVAIAAAVVLIGRGGSTGGPQGTGASAAATSPLGSSAAPTASALAELKLLWEKSGPTQPTPCCQTWWPALNPKTGDIWVADSFANVYWIFAPDGRYLESWGTPGSAPGQLDLNTHRQNPQAAGAIAFSPDGTFFVADVGNHRVQKFDAKRRFVKQWGTFGTDDGQFVQPFGIATDGKAVYVADDDRGDIQAFDTSGRFLRKFGSITTQAGIFIALDADGFLYRSGEGPFRISKYDPATGVLAATLNVAPVAGGALSGLAIDADGHVFANMGAPGLVELDRTGKQLRAWSNGGETGVVDPEGNAIYLANERAPGWSTASLRKYAIPPLSSLTMYHGGPDRTGIMPGPGPAGKPSIVWDVSRSGAIPFSIMPLVANGRVIVADASGTLAALDEGTGRELWSVGLGSTTHSSPVLVDGLVVAATDAGTIIAAKATDGARAWQKTIGGGAITASLLVANGALYVGDGNRGLFSLNPDTGKQVWSVDVGGPVTRGPAFAAGVIYVGATGGQFSAIDVVTHAELWKAQLGPGEVGTPAVGDGRVYVGRGLHASAPPHDLVALDIRDGSFLWSFASPAGRQVHMGGLANGLVYAVSDDGNVYALDAATGDQRWTARTGGSIGTLAGLVDTVVYITSADETIRAFNATTGEQLWSINVQGIPTMPAVIDGRVIVGTSLGRVVAIGGSS